MLSLEVAEMLNAAFYHPVVKGECSLITLGGGLSWEAMEETISPTVWKRLSFDMSEGRLGVPCDVTNAFRETSILLHQVSIQALLASRNASMAEGQYLLHYDVDAGKVMQSLQAASRLSFEEFPHQFIDLFGILTGLVSLIERLLTDLVSERLPEVTFPRVLKEILRHPSVAMVLSDVQIGVLQCLVGPPIGLNLRNIIWHGFWCPFDTRDRSASCTLIRYVALTLSILIALPKPSGPLQTTMIQPFAICDTFLLSPGNSLSEIEREKIVTDFRFLFTFSPFILDSRVTILSRATKLQFENEPNAGQGALACYLLLPVLENSFRRMFVAVNGLSEEILQAKSSTYYTTLDVFLSRLLLVPGEECEKTTRVNSVAEELKEPCMDLLEDLFMSPRGPKIRDKVAHYHWQPSTISFNHSEILLSILIWVSLHCCEEEQATMWRNYCSPATIDCLDRIEKYLTEYAPAFHPWAILHQSITQTRMELELSLELIAQTREKSAVQLGDGWEELSDCLKTRSVSPFHLNQPSNPYGLSANAELKVQGILSHHNLHREKGFIPSSRPGSIVFSEQLVLTTQLMEVTLRFLIKIQETWEDLSQKIVTEKANKRQIGAFDRLCDFLDDFLLMAELAILFAEISYCERGSVSNLCLAKKFLCSMSKAEAKLSTRSWDEILTPFISSCLTELSLYMR